MSGVTDTGFARERLDILLSNLVAKLKAPEVLGADAVLDGTTPDGQIAGIVAEIEDTLYQVAENVYAVVDPNNATGEALWRLGPLSGISVKLGQKATTTCLVHVKTGETLPAGTQILDEEGGVVYETGVAVGPSVGDAHDYLVSCTATTYGTVQTKQTNTAKKVVDVYGWLDVAFYTDSTTGTVAETPQKFRQRRMRSVAKPGQGMLDSLYAALADLDGIGDVSVFVNPKAIAVDIKPGDLALPAHSCRVVVRNAVTIGGVDKIAQTIWLYKNPACDNVGSTHVQVADSQGQWHDIAYDVADPYLYDLEIRYKAVPAQGFVESTDGPTLKQAVAAWANTTFMPGDDVPWGEFVPVILTAVSGTTQAHAIKVEQVRLAAHGGALAVQDLSTPYNQYPSLSVGNITIVAV
jgi:hypothetical protein